VQVKDIYDLEEIHEILEDSDVSASTEQPWLSERNGDDPKERRAR